jgi:hypothetical protein
LLAQLDRVPLRAQLQTLRIDLRRCRSASPACWLLAFPQAELCRVLAEDPGTFCRGCEPERVLSFDTSSLWRDESMSLSFAVLANRWIIVRA